MDDQFETRVDPALLDLFRAESDTHIPVLSQGLLNLEKGQANDQDIASMMRAAHSIKGTARIVGIEAAVRVAHVMEDCFTAAKENRAILSSDAVDVLLQGVDALQQICALQADSEMDPTAFESLLGQLSAVKEGKASIVSAKPTAPPPLQAVKVQVTPRTPAVSEASLVLPANFDDHESEALRGRLNDLLREGATKIRIDFGPVRHVSARALALLASLVREAGRMDPGPTLQADGLSGPLATLLRVSGLDRGLANGHSMGA